MTAETADYSGGEMLGEIPLNCVICTPRSGETLARGTVGVRGYALTGGERVEVSADGGESWTEAALTEEGGPATWLFWEASLKPEPGPCEIVAWATGSGGETQPETVDEVWTFQGYANNAWHRVSVRVGG